MNLSLSASSVQPQYLLVALCPLLERPCNIMTNEALSSPFGIPVGCAADTRAFVDPTAWFGAECRGFEPGLVRSIQEQKATPVR